MWKVTIKRGPQLDDRTWEHTTFRKALRRVFALCELHSCDYTQEGKVLIVHAEGYYRRDRTARTTGNR
jgi:hypothetical protein